VDKLPKGKGLGEPLRLHVPIQDGVKILACTALHPTPSKAAWLLLTEDAKGFRILSEDLWPSKRGSRQIATTARPLLRALLLEDPALDRVALIGSHRKMVMLPLEGIPLMKRGKGVTLQRYRDPLTVLSDVVLLPSTQTALRWRVGGDRLRTEPSLARWMGKRGDAGAMAPIGFPRDNRFPAWEPETASRSTSSQEEA
jgi:topoisomerase-4 subunit A